MKLLLNVNLYLKSVSISDVIFLGKTLSSRYKCFAEYAKGLHYLLFGQSRFFFLNFYIN